MDHHIELRRTYLGASPHTLVIGVLWIISGVISNYSSKGFVIIFFFLTAALNFPIGEMIRKLLKTKNWLSDTNNLPKLFTYMGFTIPLSIPVVYMACKANINYFFPAFAVIIGAHYLPFVWAYRMISFGILGLLIIIVGTVCAIYLPNNFSMASFTTGSLMILFALINYIIVNNELKQISYD